MLFTEFIAGRTADLLNPRSHGMSAAKRGKNCAAGGLLNRWICLLFVCFFLVLLSLSFRSLLNVIMQDMGSPRWKLRMQAFQHAQTRRRARVDLICAARSEPAWLGRTKKGGGGIVLFPHYYLINHYFIKCYIHNILLNKHLVDL